MLEDPGMGEVGDFFDQRQFVAAEAVRRFPLVAVLVKTADGDIVPNAVLGFVRPDRGLDPAQADFVNGFGFVLVFGACVADAMREPSFRE